MSNYKVPQLGSFEWQQSIIDKDLSTPVGLTPSKGNRYIVKTTGSGDWTGHSNAIATYNGATWDFVEATEGLVCYIKDEDLVYIYTTSWIIWVGACTEIKDADGDTKVETEKNADEDKVRVTTRSSKRTN